MNFKYYKTESLVAFLIALFIVCSFLADQIDRLLKQFPILETINHTIHTFSTLSLMFVGLIFINLVGWKWQIFKWLLDIPNLNGRYTGTLKSSYDNEIRRCVLEIRQSASNIHISGYFGKPSQSEASSSSHSVTEEIFKKEDGFFRIYYIFKNDTGPLEGETRDHSGTVFLTCLDHAKVLKGEYYNNRLNRGSVDVTFVQRKCLGVFYD